MAASQGRNCVVVVVVTTRLTRAVGFCRSTVTGSRVMRSPTFPAKSRAVSRRYTASGMSGGKIHVHSLRFGTPASAAGCRLVGEIVCQPVFGKRDHSSVTEFAARF